MLRSQVLQCPSPGQEMLGGKDRGELQLYIRQNRLCILFLASRPVCFLQPKCRTIFFLKQGSNQACFLFKACCTYLPFSRLRRSSFEIHPNHSSWSPFLLPALLSDVSHLGLLMCYCFCLEYHESSFPFLLADDPVFIYIDSHQIPHIVKSWANSVGEASFSLETF